MYILRCAGNKSPPKQAMVGCKAPLLCSQALLALLLLLLLPSGHSLRRAGARIPLSVHADEDINEALDAWDAKEAEWEVDNSMWGSDVRNNEERENRHPADKMLAHRHADASKSYILSGY